MRVLGSVIVVLLFLLPAPACAQSVKLENLVGGWEKNDDPNVVLTMQPDSTFRFVGKDWKGDFRRWNYLRGDTISFYDNEEFAKANQMGEPGHKITLSDQQLTLTPLDKTNQWEGGSYTRLDVPAAQPMKPADLVGTWVNITNQGDSLIVWPDSSLKWRWGSATSRWKRLTGDSLLIEPGPNFGPNFKGYKIMLNDRQQLVINWGIKSRFKRVGAPKPKP